MIPPAEPAEPAKEPLPQASPPPPTLIAPSLCATLGASLAGEVGRPAAPEAETPEASAGHQGVAPNRSSQTGALDVGCPDAFAPMPRAGPHVESLGRFLIDFEALRNRKDLWVVMIARAAH